MSQLIFHNVQYVSEGQLLEGSVLVEDDKIAALMSVAEGEAYLKSHPETLICQSSAAEGSLLLLPGCIDAHVHFREPGLTQKADIASESRAAAAGGVTFVLDMPNVKPTTTTPEALAEKRCLFDEKCIVNYGLWYGITADNIEQALADYGQPDSPHRDEICGFKVFLGSSTGGMLMNDQQKLRQLFANTQRVIGIHSESEDVIRRNAEKFRALYGDDVPVEFHPKIRDVEACMQTTRMAVELAVETGAQLHVCHLTTQEELDYITQKTRLLADEGNTTSVENLTAEVCVAHLWFSQEDYRTRGTRIKCNPAIKRIQDRDALRNALSDGRIFSVATDHAPHLLADKQGGALRAASGMPSIQYSLVAMLELSRQGFLSLPQLTELMATHPAQRFGLNGRGEIRVGNFADLVLVNPNGTTTVNKANIQSKCGWSPFEGTTFSHQVMGTWVNGKQVWATPNGTV